MNSFRIAQIAAISILIGCEAPAQKQTYPEHVGDIAYNPSLDRAGFKLCNENFVPQAYQVGTGYKGECRALIDYFKNRYSFQNSFRGKSGYITIRFVINCKGETDRFRIFQIDENFKKMEFHPSLTGQFLELLKELKEWIPGKYQGAACDSYDQLIFKIEDGRLKEVTF